MILTRRLFVRACPFLHAVKSVNSVTLVGVVHDIQTGFVYEDAVTQFMLTTTSIDTSNPAQEAVVEKDHHTVRCFGEQFSQEVKGKLKEGNVVCVNGRLRLNPQLEPACNKHFYFPYVHVQPPNGQVAVIHGDRHKPPPTVDAPTGTQEAANNAPTSSAAPAAAPAPQQPPVAPPNSSAPAAASS